MSDSRTPSRPPQVAPVARPHLDPPHTTVDVERGNVDHRIEIRVRLMHGANHNDPAPWSPAPYQSRMRQR